MKEYLITFDRKLKNPIFNGKVYSDIKRVTGKIKIHDTTPIEKILFSLNLNHDLIFVDYERIDDGLLELNLAKEKEI